MNRLRSPFAVHPLTLVFAAEQQKAFRPIHCIECGMPIIEISDRIVMAYDASGQQQRYEAGKYGVIETRCDRHTCKQRYQIQLA